MNPDLYNQDYYQWRQETVKLLEQLLRTRS